MPPMGPTERVQNPQNSFNYAMTSRCPQRGKKTRPVNDLAKPRVKCALLTPTQGRPEEAWGSSHEPTSPVGPPPTQNPSVDPPTIGSDAQKMQLNVSTRHKALFHPSSPKTFPRAM